MIVFTSSLETTTDLASSLSGIMEIAGGLTVSGLLLTMIGLLLKGVLWGPSTINETKQNFEKIINLKDLIISAKDEELKAKDTIIKTKDDTIRKLYETINELTLKVMIALPEAADKANHGGGS